jgi:hypothetical protein
LGLGRDHHFVMPALVAGIHAFLSDEKQDVDGRNKSGHDRAGETPMRNRAGNFSVGRLFEFLTALGQDVKITVKPTRKEQGEMELVVG